MEHGAEFGLVGRHFGELRRESFQNLQGQVVPEADDLLAARVRTGRRDERARDDKGRGGGDEREREPRGA